MCATGGLSVSARLAVVLNRPRGPRRPKRVINQVQDKAAAWIVGREYK